MNKLGLKKEGIYQIEVNDNGDIIEIDTLDIETPLKIQKFYDDCQNIIAFLNEKSKEFEQVEDKDLGILTEKEKFSLEALKEYCAKGRKVVDGFFGAGAAQKIFGDRNYTDMFADLFEALKPHFERAGFGDKQNSFNKAIEEKYADKDEEVL